MTASEIRRVSEKSKFDLIESIGRCFPSKSMNKKFVKLIDIIDSENVEIKIYCYQTAGTARPRRVSISDFLEMVN